MSVITDELEKTLPQGFVSLVDGYGKYATEVAVNRAIPAIDGFKPVQRRILYTMNKYKIKDLQKSANVCGKVLEFHPHSDSSVYETILPMVDSSEYTQLPFIHGKGNFSKVYFSDKDSQAAAQRYTEVCLSDNAHLLFGEMDGIEMQATEDAHSMEPVLLPVCFPNILTTPSMGIAVGLACTIPSFNFNEVLGITLQYLKEGKITQAIAPDFNCGGDMVLDNNAFKSIMLEGRGTIKLRGRWVIDNKDIIITQIPYYARISDILSVARELPTVISANDETDLSGMKIRITCSTKQVVEPTLMALLKDSKLQCTVGVNIGVVIDEEPKFIGVIDVIKSWVEFREKVLRKQYTKDLESVRYSMRAPKALVQLISNPELKNRFLDAMKINQIEAERVLREGLPDVEDDVIDYILDLKMRQFADCEGRKRQYEALANKEKELVDNLADIQAVITRQLENLNTQIKIPRKTSITTTDYTFETKKASSPSQAIENYACKVIVHDLYIKKMRIYMGTEPYTTAMNKDIISILDNKGRLLRIPLYNIPECGSSAVGAYIPTILEIDRDMQVVDWGILSTKAQYNYLYKDGYAAHLDFGEWADNFRITKMNEKGVAPEFIDKLLCKFDNKDTSDDYSKYLFIVTKNTKIGFMCVDYKYKNRTARTKLISIDKDDEIAAVAFISEAQMAMLLPSEWESFIGKTKPIKPDTNIDSQLLSALLKNRLV